VLPVWGVFVSGTHHLNPDRVAALAHATAGEPWLWVTRGRAAALLDDPWVLSASVEKRFPGRVTIRVVERVPVAVYSRSGDETRVVSEDGTPLPGAAKPALHLAGWGGSCPGSKPGRSCFQLSLQIAKLLRSLGVNAVTASPTGFTALGGGLEVWMDSVDSLLLHGGGVTMVKSLSAVGSGGNRSGSQPGAARVRVNVYPWGVSVQE
ncbi:MAG TPA: FtsQ-type POTRA domain-containing protein, partial [Deinococcales bacterium]|nr:FtsQ-type POTRA domain-containing protein [Deinococcales bacterium]